MSEITTIPVPPGKIACVVTHLEMTARPTAAGHAAPPRARPSLEVRRVAEPSADWYRALYRAVGEDWLWFSRLKLADDELLAVIRDPRVEVYALHEGGGREVGLLELDRRSPPDVELAFFGLVPDAIGKGIGRLLMDRAVELAWGGPPPRRFWVHTCSLDHPGALDFYRRSGFVPYRREVEIEDDPRLTGLLPRTAAPRHPIIGG